MSVVYDVPSSFLLRETKGVFKMPKPKRGKLARAIKNWRGVCPICNRTGVKILWEKNDGDKALRVCKQCGA